MPSMSVSALLTAASVLALIPQVLGACYLPNGVDRESKPGTEKGEFRACKSSGHSMCCNALFSDSCRANGLCYNSGSKLLWRESCTDRTWRDPACIKLCAGDNQLSEQGVPMSSIDSVITICGDNSLCCGSGSFAQRCCDAGTGFLIQPNGAVVAANPPDPTTTVRTQPQPTTVTQARDPISTPKPDTNNGGGSNTEGSAETGNANSGSGGSSGSGGNSGLGGTSNEDSGGNDADNNQEGGSSTTSPKDDSATEGQDPDETGSSKDSPSGIPDDDESFDGNPNQDKDSDKNEPSPSESSGSSSPTGGSKKTAGDGKVIEGEGDDSSGEGGEKGGNNNSALIGGVVGGVLGGVLLIVVIGGFVIRKRRASQGAGGGLARLDSSSEYPGSHPRSIAETSAYHKQDYGASTVTEQRIPSAELPIPTAELPSGGTGSYFEMEATVPNNRC